MILAASTYFGKKVLSGRILMVTSSVKSSVGSRISKAVSSQWRRRSSRFFHRSRTSFRQTLFRGLLPPGNHLKKKRIHTPGGERRKRYDGTSPSKTHRGSCVSQTPAPKMNPTWQRVCRHPSVVWRCSTQPPHTLLQCPEMARGHPFGLVIGTLTPRPLHLNSKILTCQYSVFS